MFATIRQTRADERNLFQVESEESGILYRAETPWSGLNLPFDAENLRKLVFTDDGGKEMFHTEDDIRYFSREFTVFRTISYSV